MNIISNNCTTGFLYRNMGIQFNNPFFWNLISAEDYTNLILNFNYIDFNSTEFQLSESGWVYVMIDNKIRVNYIHCKYKSGSKTERIGFDIFSDDPIYYAKNKYISRLERMKLSEERPLFFICEDITPNVDTVTNKNLTEVLNKLRDKGCKEQLVLFTHKPTAIENYKNLNLKLYYPPDLYVGHLADWIVYNRFN